MKIWRVDYSDSIYTDASMQNIKWFRGLRYFDGIPLNDRFPKDATLEVRTERIPTDFFRAGVFWIVSAKLRNILEDHGVEAEYFSVRVLDRRANMLNGSWRCFNPLLAVDWFDWSQSKYVVEQTFATKITVVAARQELLNGVPLALAQRTIPDLVAVSDELAATITENGCTGFVFREPHQWTSPADPVLS